MASVGPPAANGATIVMGRVGYICALAICETAGIAAAPATRCKNVRRGSFIFEPPSRHSMELAALHSITSSCFGVRMTRLVNEQNIRTPQRIENRACNDPGILTTDMKPISCGLPSMRVMCIEYSIRN
jgi:hypothetical protein